MRVPAADWPVGHLQNVGNVPRCTGGREGTAAPPPTAGAGLSQRESEAVARPLGRAGPVLWGVSPFM